MKLEDVILRSTRALQPAANAVAAGTIYFVTDELLLERSTGSVWESYSGTVIANGSVTYAKIQDVSATARILARKTAAAGDVEEATLSEILDFIGSAAQGDILYRGAATWARLAAGTAGQFLKTQGAAANPIWDTVSSGLSRIEVDITDAQFKTMNSAPFQIIPAPGAGKIIIIANHSIQIDKASGAYNTSAVLEYRYAGTATAATGTITPGLNTTNPAFAFGGSLAPVITAAAPVNLGIVLRSSADLTGGHANNSARVTLFYHVFNSLV